MPAIDVLSAFAFPTGGRFVLGVKNDPAATLNQSLDRLDANQPATYHHHLPWLGLSQ
jgi:hypothetical protein